MVAFRKWFFVLAIAALLLGSSTANAQIGGQTPLTCIANAGVPPIVRSEGLTELVGDLVLICTGGNTASPFLANFQVFLNTNITSRLLGSDYSEALLLIDEPLVPRAESPTGLATPATPLCLAPQDVNTYSTGGPGGPATPTGFCNAPGLATNANGTSRYQTGTYTAFRGRQTTTVSAQQQNALVWPGIPVQPPGSTGSRIFRFTNIRANASVIGAASTLIPNQITAFISVSASQSLAINNPQQTVAYVQQGLAFDVRRCDNGAGSPNPALSQCTSFNSDVFGDPNRSGASAASFAVRFREGFQTAFKPQTLPGQENSVPGVVYNSESGFTRTANSAEGFGVIGVANTATRVAARFRNIPADVKLFVTVASVGTSAQARLVQAGPNGEGSGVSFSTGSGFNLFVTPTTNLSCTVSGTTTTTVFTFDGVVQTRNAAEITVTGGTATAVWEVISSSPSLIDELIFQVGVSFRANPATPTPALGQSSVAGSFAPFYAGANDVANAAGRASASLPVPRFLDSLTFINDFRIEACETVLLFPFVTAQSGFDTGIAISNTSADNPLSPGGSTFANPQDRRQGGACDISYFGSVTGGGLPPNPQTTNASIPAGGQLTFVLSSGGGFGITGTPGFQGYIFARCAFRYAHGFAFITDGPVGQARVAEGYLALVVTPTTDFGSDRGRIAESLGH